MNSGISKMKQIMRDVFIEELYHKMVQNENIFFLSADFGSPKIDLIRKDNRTKDRFINVGIAEQNLIDVGFGLAFEGYTVYCYGITTFLTLRALEQIRNLSINYQCLRESQGKEININLIGVGTGLSYGLSGPSHSCLEDLSIIRTIPNIEIISPSDCVITKKFVDYSIISKKIKYFRFEGKPVEQIYNESELEILEIIERGFIQTIIGLEAETCIISTGYMIHKALEIVHKDNYNYKNEISVIDIFQLDDKLNRQLLYNLIKEYKYKNVITLEEGFISRGGLDSIILNLLNDFDTERKIKLRTLGFNNRYIFEIGDREYLHKLNGLDNDSIINIIKEMEN